MQSLLVPTVGYEPIAAKVAELPRRALAWLIDMAVLIAYLAIWYVIVDMTEEAYAPDLLLTAKSPLWYLALIPAITYSWWTTVLFEGRTLGNHLVGIRIISLDGRTANLFQLGIRWTLRIIDVWGLVIIPGLPGVIVGVFSPYGQGLGDLLGGTLVIRSPKRVKIDLGKAYADQAHTLEYPEVVQLSDRDIAILKEILSLRKRKKDQAYTQRLANRVAGVMHVTPRHEPEVFLQKVLQDYHHYYASKDI